MLTVASEQDALHLLDQKFGQLRMGTELVTLSHALGRVLVQDSLTAEDVPEFDRSMVDGFAVRASDTFGCSENLPAILTLAGEIKMGQAPQDALRPGVCMAIPTGGHLPDGSDAVAMIEYSEPYGDGTVGILKPVAPGQNIIYRGDDVRAGTPIVPAGKRLQPHDIGALAAGGITELAVSLRPVVGILSTGDELVEIEEKPQAGQVRDVNSHLLKAAVEAAGGIAQLYGIVRDEVDILRETMMCMAEECDLVLLSGGSSVGQKDATAQLIEAQGTLYVHGIAIKPGKPTILGEIAGKPVFGLPGHPVAAYFVYSVFVKPLLASLQGEKLGVRPSVEAKLRFAVPSNHGREEYVPVRLFETQSGVEAEPLISKSGLITKLAGSSGYLKIPRDTEGFAAGETVRIWLYS